MATAPRFRTPSAPGTGTDPIAGGLWQVAAALRERNRRKKDRKEREQDTLLLYSTQADIQREINDLDLPPDATADDRLTAYREIFEPRVEALRAEDPALAARLDSTVRGSIASDIAKARLVDENRAKQATANMLAERMTQIQREYGQTVIDAMTGRTMEIRQAGAAKLLNLRNEAADIWEARDPTLAAADAGHWEPKLAEYAMEALSTESRRLGRSGEFVTQWRKGELKEFTDLMDPDAVQSMMDEHMRSMSTDARAADARRTAAEGDDKALQEKLYEVSLYGLTETATPRAQVKQDFYASGGKPSQWKKVLADAKSIHDSRDALDERDVVLNPIIAETQKGMLEGVDTISTQEGILAARDTLERAKIAGAVTPDFADSLDALYDIQEAEIALGTGISPAVIAEQQRFRDRHSTVVDAQGVAEAQKALDRAAQDGTITKEFAKSEKSWLNWHAKTFADASAEIEKGVAPEVIEYQQRTLAGYRDITSVEGVIAARKVLVEDENNGLVTKEFSTLGRRWLKEHESALKSETTEKPTKGRSVAQIEEEKRLREKHRTLNTVAEVEQAKLEVATLLETGKISSDGAKLRNGWLTQKGKVLKQAEDALAPAAKLTVPQAIRDRESGLMLSIQGLSSKGDVSIFKMQLLKLEAAGQITEDGRKLLKEAATEHGKVLDYADSEFEDEWAEIVVDPLLRNVGVTMGEIQLETFEGKAPQAAYYERVLPMLKAVAVQGGYDRGELVWARQLANAVWAVHQTSIGRVSGTTGDVDPEDAANRLQVLIDRGAREGYAKDSTDEELMRIFDAAAISIPRVRGTRDVEGENEGVGSMEAYAHFEDGTFIRKQTLINIAHSGLPEEEHDPIWNSILMKSNAAHHLRGFRKLPTIEERASASKAAQTLEADTSGEDI